MIFLTQRLIMKASVSKFQYIQMLKEMLIAGAGGFIGTCGRYLAGRLCALTPVASFPLSTLTVNVLGCFLIGLLFGTAERTGILTHGHILFLATGFCGGFTTYSAFADDIWVLCAKGEVIMSVFYLILTIVAGIGAVWLGRFLAN